MEPRVVTRRGDTDNDVDELQRALREVPGRYLPDAGNIEPTIVGGMMYKQGVDTVYQGALDDLRIFRRCVGLRIEIDCRSRANGDEMATGRRRPKLAIVVPLVASGRDAMIPRVNSRLPSVPAVALKLNGSRGGVTTDLALDPSKHPLLTISAWVRIDGAGSDSRWKHQYVAVASMARWSWLLRGLGWRPRRQLVCRDGRRALGIRESLLKPVDGTMSSPSILLTTSDSYWRWQAIFYTAHRVTGG